MQKYFKKRKTTPRSEKQHFDYTLMVAFALLIIFGLVMLFSASSVISYIKFGNTYHYFLSQLVGLGLGLIAFFVILQVDYHQWKKFSKFFLFLSILLLIVVFIPGLRASYGTARSWIVIFGFSLQTSELVKISFLLFLATWLESKQKELNSFNSIVVPFLAIVAVISVLMLAQPNLGTLFVILSISFAVLFIGGVRFRHLLFMVLLGLGALVLLLTIHHPSSSAHSSYQLDRFRCLQNLDYSAQGRCYQVKQSLIAIGSGRIIGRGLGKSRQKFLYLPEVWADSIFPVIAEETGFVFSSLLILLYLFIFYRGLLIARHAPDLYGRMLATGIIVWLAVESFMNIGGMMNLIPMTGVPLPFISAGGSAILASLIALGVLLNISKQTIPNSRRLEFRRRK